MLQGVLLRIAQVAHQRARGARSHLQVAQAEHVQRGDVKVMKQCLLGAAQAKRPLRIRRDGHLRAQGVRQRHSALVGDDLARNDARQLVRQARGVGLIGEELARGHIRKGDARALAVGAQREDVAVSALAEHRLLDDRSGRHDADDVALDQPLAQRRVLQLFADGDLVPQPDEPVDVRLRRVVGHAAHGRALLQAAVLARERQLQLA